MDGTHVDRLRARAGRRHAAGRVGLYAAAIAAALVSALPFLWGTVTALKQVLGRHPGPSDVHLRLVSGDSSTVLRLDDHLRVETSSSLMGDLKALLGPAAVGS